MPMADPFRAACIYCLSLKVPFPLIELVEGVSPRFIVDTVVDLGCHVWYSIGMVLCRQNDAIVSAWAADKVSFSDKLLAIIRKKQERVGLKTVAEELLFACRTIPDPIYGGVMEEAMKRNAAAQGILFETVH